MCRSRAPISVSHTSLEFFKLLENSTSFLVELKEDFQNKLMAQKLKVELLQQSVAQAKQNYSETLRSLENISEEIHERRLLSRPREPGVGAEKGSSPPPSLNFDLDRCDIVSLV